MILHSECATMYEFAEREEDTESPETDSPSSSPSYCCALLIPPGTKDRILTHNHFNNNDPLILPNDNQSSLQVQGGSGLVYKNRSSPVLPLEMSLTTTKIFRANDSNNSNIHSSVTGRRKMAYYHKSKANFKLFSNPIILLLILSSFLSISSSSEVSFQQQFDSSSTNNNNINSGNANANSRNINNGIFNTNFAPGTSSNGNSQQSLQSAISSPSSSASTTPSVLTAYFIAGLANQIRKINSTAMMFLSREEPFQLQFRTACPFGNIVYDDKFAISINSGGNMTYSTKPNEFPSSIYHHSVADGQWHSITFTGSLISLDDHEFHPHLVEERTATPVINWDTNSSAENDQTRLNHMLHFFDGFVGCIRVPKPNHTHSNGGRNQQEKRSHEENYYMPESPSEHRMISLHDLFQLQTPFPPCNDTSIDLTTIHSCFNPDDFILCNKCQNGASCQPESTTDHSDNTMNNQCHCPPNTEETEYSGLYCEYPPTPGSQQVEDFSRQMSSEMDNISELGDPEATMPISSPSNIDPTTTNLSDLASGRMSLVASVVEPIMSTTTTEAPPVTFVIGDSCPCLHGGVCTRSNSLEGQHFCNCTQTGYNGTYCDTDINECEKEDKCKNGGLCVNTDGGYSCYCKPGFAGKHCAKNFNECLSNPCLHGTCFDGIDEYSCECHAGYTGTDCDKEINECETPSNPCENGATCIDEIANYTCNCQPGYDGRNCSNDIDECASSPCQSGGECIDKVNGFLCNCTNTGFFGSLCEQNVDDCARHPSEGPLCLNGGNCTDAIKDFICICHPGYYGHECEKDLDECKMHPCANGECFQKSDSTLYETDNQRLQHLLGYEFHYEDAAGYVCLCNNGYEGENCTIDIDECARAGNPCGATGKCIDGVASYRCECYPGFRGEHCEIDINECDSNPCVKGECINKVADFECICPEGFGAKNCSVPLVGCIKNPCGKTGTCLAKYDEATNKHNFSCDCQSGFAGETCRLKTTMSFNGSGPVEFPSNDQQYENGNYELLFRFTTTLPDVLLFIGSGLTYFSLTLSGGKLNLKSSLLNNLDGISAGSNLANATWHNVYISVNLTHIALSVDSHSTIHPIQEGDDSHTGFNRTFIGGDTPDLKFLSQGKGISHFVGCMEDIIINGKRIIPENLNASTIEVGCTRTDQCKPNPCYNSGNCTDLWQSFTCKCLRPYLGDTCQHEYTAGTFNHENTSSSLVSVEIPSDVANKFISTFDISMFVRTRQRGGTIFLLGNEKNGNYSVFLEADVGEVGNLVVQAKWSDQDDANTKPEVYAVDGLQISDGEPHLISIQRDKGLVKISVNGTEHFRKSVSNRITFNPTRLYIGGKPTSLSDVTINQVESRVARSLIVEEEIEDIAEDSTHSTVDPESFEPVAVATTDSKETLLSSLVSLVDNNEIPVVNEFKGVIQDIRVNFSATEVAQMGLGHNHPQHAKSQNNYVVEFYPLDINTTYAMGEPLGKVVLQNLTYGTVSDNACKINNCQNEGTCVVTWNDFICNCTDEYDGRFCEFKLPCAIMNCPEGSVCHNIGWKGFECVSDVAFDGNGAASPHYHLMSNELENVTFYQASFRFRSKRPGNILYLANGSQSFHIGLEQDLDTKQNLSFDSIAIYLDGERHSARIPNILDGRWHNVSAKFDNNDNGPRLLVDEKELPLSPAINKSIPLDYLNDLVKSPQTEIVVGSHIEQRDHYHVDNPDDHENHIGHPEDAHNKFYRGCLSDITLGNYRLPFVTPSQLKEINSDNMTLAHMTAPTAFYIEESSSVPVVLPHLGCILCYQNECQNQGSCSHPEEVFECSCPRGFEGDHCETNYNECLENDCENGAICQDGIANYTCSCPPGYEGWRCDIDINECEPDDGIYPCKHGGTCIDLIASYNCVCTEEFLGQNCEKRKRSSCRDDPCENGATCYDRPQHHSNDVTFECACQAGWEGETCSSKVDYCKNIRCANGGSCENKPLGYECHCVPGYDGPQCEININDCAKKPCLNNGTCEDLIDDFACHCQSTGFTGPICEIDVNECEGRTLCPEMQRCENTIGSFKCVCPDPAMCGEHCDLLDPCYNRTCFNGGSCRSTCHDEFDKHWECDCLGNYEGEFCELLMMARPNQPIDILLIIIPVIAAFLIAGLIAVVILVRMARKKRATRGVYSPSQQEYCNPRVELDNIIKPPPEERLI